ncbi:uncharacterized protein [Medicago truncatula]|nr:uncharacterized protein LOC11405562 [Medicago truncatula]XP_024633956.1 uncharacterized protein LOC11405562 [Medicago truncatula]XP_024633957.1 uncharacterized protein LOC11405562 [Medicago truncatula]XP_024633958.1 uncharacterized protein LOC11405562 [Medicago truncatula]XP_039688424.1 uncharacterized protein LOC11405562 [Medicago truncatula]
MHSYLTSQSGSFPIVIVLQLCKLKKYFGVMGVSNAFHGTKLIINSDDSAIREYMTKLEGVDVEVSQGVSQVSGLQIVPMSDDMLQLHMMMIEDIIESTDSCVAVVVATICDIEAEHWWYYEACTKCAGRVTIVAGRMFCGRCNQSRNAVQRCVPMRK